MKIRGKGILQHHFWGTYYASLAIEFEDEFEARLAFESGKVHSSFHIGEKHLHVLTCTVESEVLDEVIENLVGLGAKKEAIASVSHSIDWGDDWEIEFEVNDPRQIGLFNE